MMWSAAEKREREREKEREREREREREGKWALKEDAFRLRWPSK
jgi:hypothetical protein